MNSQKKSKSKRKTFILALVFLIGEVFAESKSEVVLCTVKLLRFARSEVKFAEGKTSLTK